MEFSEDLILSEGDIENLFTNEGGSTDSPVEETVQETEEESPVTTDEVDNPEELFESQENVGSEEENIETQEAKSNTSSENFYSTIASALKEEGILSDLEDGDITSISDAEGFRDAIEKQIAARLSEKQRRVDLALSADLDSSEIRSYETVIANLEAIKESQVIDETSNGESLRKKLIFQDYLNKGYSEERAKREVQKSFSAGTDVEDAKEALSANKEFFKSSYQKILDEAEEQIKADKERVKKESVQLKKAMLEDKEVLEGVTLDSNLRKRAYEALTKPIHRTEDGEYLTAIQKYEQDNPVEFRKYLGILFAVTNGFKTISPLVDTKVKKQVKSKLSELENKLINTSSSGGNLRFIGDNSSASSQSWDLDI